MLYRAVGYERLCPTHAQLSTIIYSRWTYRYVDRSTSFMLRFAMVFLVIAIIAAAIGFDGFASGLTRISRIFFFVFLVLFLGSLILDFINFNRKQAS